MTSKSTLREILMKKFKLLMCSFAVLVTALSAGATTIPHADLGKLVDDADLIFAGKVIGIESVPTADGSYAFTYVTFDIDQAFKGVSRSGKTITLRFAGGQVGETLFEVSGAPTFALGGQHLLFVEGNDRLGVPLVGWSQGKIDLVAHPVSQQPLLVDHAGRAIDGIKGNGWRRDGLKLQKDGSIQALRAAEAEVVSQEGVKIELEKLRGADRAASAASVMGELRSFIARRKASSPAFRDTQFVESASRAHVPATFGYTAARAK
jgi:hypothetical protein